MDKQFMIGVIREYGGNCDVCDCENCDGEQIEECYNKANSYCNDVYRESIDYGVYDSDEDFWNYLIE